VSCRERATNQPALARQAYIIELNSPRTAQSIRGALLLFNPHFCLCAQDTFISLAAGFCVHNLAPISCFVFMKLNAIGRDSWVIVRCQTQALNCDGGGASDLMSSTPFIQEHSCLALLLHTTTPTNLLLPITVPFLELNGCDEHHHATGTSYVTSQISTEHEAPRQLRRHARRRRRRTAPHPPPPLRRGRAPGGRPATRSPAPGCGWRPG
jgi:hypothetical protein